MSKRILSLLLALVLLVGLVPFGTIPAHAIIPDNERATFGVSADDKELNILNKGDDVVPDEGTCDYEPCENHGMYPNDLDYDHRAFGCTIVYPVGTKTVTLKLDESGDLWKSDGSHYKCESESFMRDVEVLTDPSDYYLLMDCTNDRQFALYFQVDCKHAKTTVKFESNNDGTHNMVDYCTVCGAKVSSSLQNCADKDKDGKCDKCGYVMGAATPKVTVTGFDSKDMVQHYDVGAAPTGFVASATSPDGGELSYQWYVNTVEGYDGATAIDGANTASFTPDTSAKTDMKFYFCRVTNTNDAGTATEDSGLQAVIVGKVPTTTVYFSLSDDGHYVVGDRDGGGSGEVQALRKVTVPYFDLGLYGLEGFYFKSESYGPDPDNPDKPGSDLTPGTSAFAYGKITDLHLMIYMLETQYCGISAEEAGKGYLFNEGLMGTPVFNISGSTGSFFMNEVWGHDLNLNYYHNYVYPLATGGWGSTMDQILCHDGDVFTMMMFTSWAFYMDPGAGFNHFGTASNQIPAELEVLKDKTLELTLYRSYGFGGDYSTSHTVVTDELPVYYTALEDLYDGEVETWTSCGTTSADGTFTVDAKKLGLEVGKQYLFAVGGQKGVDNPDDYVSAPGGVIVDVVKTLSDPGEAMDVYITLDGSDSVSDFGKLDYVTVPTFDKVCTDVTSALDVISEATGYTFVLTDTGITSVTDPNGVTVANGQYGPNSKWTFKVNGENPADYAEDGIVGHCQVLDGDEFTLTYTADRTEMPISVTVEGSKFDSAFLDLTDTFNGSTYSGQTAADALTQVLTQNGYTYAGSTSYVIGITDSNGVTLSAGDKTHGPWSGWMFTINGELPTLGVDPETGYTIYATLDTYVLQEGDVLRMYFVNCPTDSGDHTWNEGEITKAPTCKDEGEKTYTCTVCGATKTEPIEKLATHTWDEGKVTKAPTLYEDGRKTYTCTVCGDTYSVRIPKLDSCDGGKDCPSHKFTDVNNTEWYHSAVDYAVHYEFFAGTSDTTFSPNAPMTRAMLVTVLWRIAGRPEAKATTSFQDVPANQYYAEAVAWAKENGIVAGTSATTFSPNAKVTREQMAAILFRFAKYVNVVDMDRRGDLKSFPDASSVSSYAEEALSWAVEYGLISGTLKNGKAYLDPQGNATRAQVASVLMRFNKMVVPN